MLRTLLVTIVLILANFSWSQQSFFTNGRRLLFIGADKYSQQQLVVGTDLLFISDTSAVMDYTLMLDWIAKDTLKDTLYLDRRSINSDLFKVTSATEVSPAYRFTNSSGFELLVVKEKLHSYYHSQDGKLLPATSYHLSYARLSLPPGRNEFVDVIPLLHDK